MELLVVVRTHSVRIFASVRMGIDFLIEHVQIVWILMSAERTRTFVGDMVREAIARFQ